MIEVHNYGRIETLIIPDGWSESVKTPKGRMVRRFLLDANDKVEIALCIGSAPISFSSRNELHKVLNSPPHELTPREQLQLQEVLMTMPSKDSFQPLSIRTEIVDGQKILIGEGRWTSLGYDTISFFLDVGGEFTLVQQVYFAAPKEMYSGFLAPAKAILYAIKLSNLAAAEVK